MLAFVIEILKYDLFNGNLWEQYEEEESGDGIDGIDGGERSEQSPGEGTVET